MLNTDLIFFLPLQSYQNYAQSGTTHEQLNQQAQVPGPNPASGVQNNMYAQRPNTVSIHFMTLLSVSYLV